MEMLGVRSMASEWRMIDGCAASQLFVDASAALSIAKRHGAGKMRRINVKTLWLQEKAVQLELDYVKVKGEEKTADGLTKHVKQELAERYLKTTGLQLDKDRAKTSLRLAGHF